MNTKMVFDEDVVFVATRNTAFTIPMPTATDATGNDIQVTVKGVDSKGSEIYIRNNKFTPWFLGNYVLVLALLLLE